MSTAGRTKGDTLLEIRGLRIEGLADEEWHEIVHGIDLDLNRGEVLGLIGESGAGKSTIGLSAMAYGRGGVRITGGQVFLNGRDILAERLGGLRALRGAEVTYVARVARADQVEEPRVGCGVRPGIQEARGVQVPRHARRRADSRGAEIRKRSSEHVVAQRGPRRRGLVVPGQQRGE